MVIHRIILLNFTEREAQTVAKAGYNVDRGFVGKYHDSKYIPFQTPRPLYEYDILFYNSQLASELEKEFTNLRNLLEDAGSWEALNTFKSPPAVRISLLGESNGLGRLVHGGVPFVALTDAEKNVSSFVEAGSETATFAIAELHRLIAGFKTRIANVGQFSSVPSNIYPFYHMPVLMSRSGKEIACYGTTYEGETVPRYIVLPQLKNTPAAVVQILQCLETVFPKLFPDKVKREWLNSREFLLPEERHIQEEIEHAIAQTMAVMKQKKGSVKALPFRTRS